MPVPPPPPKTEPDPVKELVEKLKWHVVDMKAREQEQSRKLAEDRTKYETILDERMRLENCISKLSEKSV